MKRVTHTRAKITCKIKRKKRKIDCQKGLKKLHPLIARFATKRV